MKSKRSKIYPIGKRQKGVNIIVTIESPQYCVTYKCKSFDKAIGDLENEKEIYYKYEFIDNEP
jgi:hypothetical protein